jgi:ABC-type multidrug transport system fused ATPase/permease subunit
MLIILATFSSYTLIEGKTSDAATAFTTMGLMNIVRMLLTWFPNQVMSLSKAKVSVDRIAKYLKEEEIEKYSQDQISGDLLVRSGKSVGLNDAEYTYYESDSDENTGFTLRNLSVDFPVGKLFQEENSPWLQALPVLGNQVCFWPYLVVNIKLI